jgi:predicted  nucleic acid-binding Zn-ribbon protein
MASDHTIFELERFAWGAPDRLELSGKFIGLPEAPGTAPVLVLSSTDGVHRLPAVPDSLSGPPEDGQQWDAAFAWQEAPVAFDVAKLEFGPDIMVELPEPGATQRRSRHEVLGAKREPVEEGGDAGPEPEGAEAPPPKAAVPGDGVERLRLQAELLATQEALREVQATLEQTRQELTRAQNDLGSERELRAADAERFREGLGTVRDAAEQALAAEQSAEQQIESELREALETIEAKDAALEELRGQLEAATATRAEAESEARAEIEALREQVHVLRRARLEADELGAELERTRTEADGTRARLDQARSALEAARSDAERLLGRLSTFRDAAEDDR